MKQMYITKQRSHIKKKPCGRIVSDEIKDVYYYVNPNPNQGVISVMTPNPRKLLYKL